ncbi:MAG: DUF58 domain-containing protein [Longimicrobiales bacterium]|nr:DUF58 domain-containing protein [Longimicrobiales bacterium]
MTLFSRIRERRRPERPAPEDGHATAVLVQEVRRLELRARRLVDSHALGPYKSVFRGHGIEFSEVRAYEPGDPFQSIDWKVTARMRKPFVKRFVEERELSVLVVVDISASTGFGTRGMEKRRLATEVAGVLILAAMRAQDRVGLLLFTDRCEKIVRPLRGRNRTLRLLYDLLAFEPEGRGTDLEGAILAADRVLSTRSIVIVLSDFALPEAAAEEGEVDGPRAAFLRALTGLSHRHDVVTIGVRDPAEASLPDAGFLDVEDPETGRRATLDLQDASVREHLERQAADEEEQMIRELLGTGADWLGLRTDRPYPVELHAFFAARERRGEKRR